MDRTSRGKQTFPSGPSIEGVLSGSHGCARREAEGTVGEAAKRSGSLWGSISTHPNHIYRFWLDIYIYIISVRTLLGFHCSCRSICPFVTSLVDYFPLLFGDASNLDSEFILSMGIEYQDQHLPGSSKNLTFSDILSYVPCRIAPQIILNTPQ